MNRPNKFIVHHTGGTDANPLADSSNYTVEQCDVDHSRRWPGFTSKKFKNNVGSFYHVGYHFFIDNNGIVTQCRDITEEGAHCIGQNSSSIGIVLAGNFDLTTPTSLQLRAFRKLVNKLSKETGIPVNMIFPHRKFASKTCYGRNLSDTFFTEVITRGNEEEVKTLRIKLAQLKSKLAETVTKKRMSKHEVNRK